MSNNITCSCCGASQIQQLEDKSLGVCTHCGSTVIMPRPNEEIIALLNTAYLQRANYDFDAAIKTYEFAITKDKREKSAYEGLLLAKYGIEYVKDPRTNTLVPTCHRTHFNSIYEDETYKTLLSLCDDEEKDSLKNKVKKIEELQQAISKQLEKEEDFDVFISYKATDPNGDRTEDSIIARNIYDQLTKYGFKVFLAEKTLESRLGSDYEPIIFKAINTSEIFILVGTKKEYINSVWVKNEWTRFIDRIRTDDELSARSFIPVFKDMSPNDMPTVNNKYAQGVDASKLGYEITVADGVSKYIKPRSQKEEPASTFRPNEPEEELDIYQRRKLRREQAFNENLARRKESYRQKFENKKEKKQAYKANMARLKENKKSFITLCVFEVLAILSSLAMVLTSLITKARFVTYPEFAIFPILIVALIVFTIISAKIRKKHGVCRINFHRAIPFVLCIASLGCYFFLAFDAFTSYNAAGAFAGGYYTRDAGKVVKLSNPSSNDWLSFFGGNRNGELVIPTFIDGTFVDLREIYSYDRVSSIVYKNDSTSCENEDLDLYLRCDKVHLETTHKNITLYAGFVTTLEIYNPETVENLNLLGGANSLHIGKVKNIFLANATVPDIVVFGENEKVTIEEDIYANYGSAFSATFLRTKEIVIDLNSTFTQSLYPTLNVAKDKTEKIVINRNVAHNVIINYEGDASDWANVEVVDIQGTPLEITPNLNRRVISN